MVRMIVGGVIRVRTNFLEVISRSFQGLSRSKNAKFKTINTANAVAKSCKRANN